jgi:hypothetical protein
VRKTKNLGCFFREGFISSDKAPLFAERFRDCGRLTLKVAQAFLVVKGPKPLCNL